MSVGTSALTLIGELTGCLMWNFVSLLLRYGGERKRGEGKGMEGQEGKGKVSDCEVLTFLWNMPCTESYSFQ